MLTNSRLTRLRSVSLRSVRVMSFRMEKDSFGEIEVDEKMMYGAQTQRSLQNFKIGVERFPSSFIKSLALQKKCASMANVQVGALEKEYGDAIAGTAQRIIDGEFCDHFPLSIWQTGSGTQMNMNMNEVIANVANKVYFKQSFGSMHPIHPNDTVNRSQSSNDTIPTAMNIATALEAAQSLLPALRYLHRVLIAKSNAWAHHIKIGRTHLMDATPITCGQEFSSYARQIEASIHAIEACLNSCVYGVAQGGTAVGTGLNCPSGFRESFVAHLAAETCLPFVSSANTFTSLSAHDDLLTFHAHLNTTATALHKIANDIRLLASGPRCGLGEYQLPANEPGSSIMPGKVNPTQCEAMCMVATQVMGNHTTITIANSNGHLQLNAYKPVIIYNLLQSIRLLADATNSFVSHCIDGMMVNSERIKSNVSQSLMLVTALNPHIGYDKAAEVAKLAYEQDITLKEAVLQLGYLSEEQADKYLVADHMIGAP